MSVRIYLMPLITDNSKPDPVRRPKYISEFGTGYALVDYGPEPVCLISLDDVSDANHAILASHADVTALPANLNQTIGAQLSLVQNALASLNIPENWVQANHTYVQVLRVVVLIFQFVQKFNATLPNALLFSSGVTLATRVNLLPANVRTALNSAATSLGFDTSGLGGNTTLRSAIKAMADQFTNIEIFVGPQAF